MTKSPNKLATKPILISGIQPSGKLHIGNYLGALKNFVELQNSGKYQCYFFIADYHSMTESFDSRWITELMSDYIAAGLSAKKSVLFVQSKVPQSTELAWILSTLTPLGELERMTQFKEKGENKARANVGLFTYPILMASDIILYDAEFVPVGNDQDQHLELTRTLAKKFNSKFGKIFVEPKSVHTSTPRIMSLNDPLKKMSKSIPEGCLFLDDSPEIIKKKISRAVTDSGSEVKFDESNKPGVTNLINIYHGVTNRSINQIESEFKDKNYGQFKEAVTGALVKELEPFRNINAVLSKKAKLVFAAGAKKAKQKATKKMEQVKKEIKVIEN